MPTDYGAFLSAVSTASGALIGLLFVAVTVDPERVRHQAQADRQLNAGMAFFAFVDTLFVSLSGLLPDAGAAGTSRIFGLLGLVLTVGAGRVLGRRRQTGEASPMFLPLLLVTAAVYAAQVVVSQVLLGSPDRAWAQNDLCATLMILLVVGILRSWELLGMGRGSFTAVIGMKGPGAPEEGPEAARDTAP